MRERERERGSKNESKRGRKTVRERCKIENVHHII